MGSRKTEVELCFDSMTDLITNLAGGLILVVLLLMGMTQAAPRSPQADRPPGRVARRRGSGTSALVVRLRHFLRRPWTT